MVRPRRWLAVVGLGLLASTQLVGCFYGNPFNKGDGSGTGTGRPAVPSVDQGRTGGLGSVRSNTALAPAGTATGAASSPGAGAH